MRRRLFKEDLLADLASCVADWKEGSQDVLLRLVFQQRWLLDRRAGLIPDWQLTTSSARQDARQRELDAARLRAERKLSSMRYQFREEQSERRVLATSQRDGKLDPEHETILRRALQAQITDLIEQVIEGWLAQHLPLA